MPQKEQKLSRQSRRWHPRVVQSASCVVRELTSPRLVQSTSWQSASSRIRKLSSNSLVPLAGWKWSVHHAGRKSANQVHLNDTIISSEHNNTASEVKLAVQLSLHCSCMQNHTNNSNIHHQFLTSHHCHNNLAPVDRQGPFNGLFSQTILVTWHQKS